MHTLHTLYTMFIMYLGHELIRLGTSQLQPPSKGPAKHMAKDDNTLLVGQEVWGTVLMLKPVTL